MADQMAAGAMRVTASTRLRPGLKRLIWATAATAGAMALARIPWPTGSGTWLQGSFSDAMGESIWLGLGVSWLAGIGTSLTPCVYPMIVVTVSVFGAREARTRTQGALLSTMFVLGIAAMFTPLGLAAAAAGGAFGTALANPFVIIGIGLLFVALAASMFGAFDLTLPSSWQNKLATVGGAGYGGAFLLGLVSGVIAAPCTGPVLNAIILWVATTKNLVVGGLVLFAFSIGLGMLFWLVGTFSISLPKSGKWMVAVKNVFGMLMLVMALYYARLLFPAAMDLLTHNDVVWIATGALLFVGLMIGAVDLAFSGPWSERIRKGAAVVLAVGGAFGLVGYAIAEPPGARIAWDERVDRAISVIDAAKREGTPVFVDFGASWCPACGELDRHTFTDPRIVAESRRFKTVRVDASRMTDDIRRVWARYRVRGLPVVLLLDAQGREQRRVVEFIDADRFLGMMRNVR